MTAPIKSLFRGSRQLASTPTNFVLLDKQSTELLTPTPTTPQCTIGDLLGGSNTQTHQHDRSHSHCTSPTMLNLFHLLSLLGLLTSLASSTALTYRLAPNEKECFYTHVEKKDAKVAFYFAVQAGGSFDGIPTSLIAASTSNEERESILTKSQSTT